MNDRPLPIHATAFTAPEVPATESVMAYLRLHLAERQGWDEAPEVGVLHTPVSDSVSAYALPVPTASWDAYNQPPRLLLKMVRVLYEQGRTDHALVRGIDRTMLTDMIGIYFRYEGWAPPKGGQEMAARLLQRGASYRMADAADRRELRTILAILINGEMLQCAVYRDEPHRVLTSIVSGGVSNQEKLMNARYLEDLPAILSGLMYGLLGTMRLKEGGSW